MAIDLLESNDHILTKSFPKSTWRATYKLHFVHTNIFRPQRTSSLASSRYYKWLEYSRSSRRLWKIKVVTKFKYWGSDSGKEYTLENFNAFCEEIDIEHQLIAPYTL
ncbi:Retrovirus-related Pol polyprotein from transposon TNT 1-94 [Gossypium australe]|uniref:Retrovirus-related Pol polyprotein from transposon TNT 1-94 n=1 Tax=Gossypium australe TaxID=47621 RepID=A0A5B6VVC0_9ROSI|nr:Retrovirus-related Pol polyprotein from transposon TNT 1-94 [Gossypium australe]